MKSIFSVSITFLFLILNIFTWPSHGHEGHNHAPSDVSGPHGGSIQKSKKIHWEIVQDSKIKLYPFLANSASKELKPVSPSEIKVTSKITIHNGKKPKPQPIKLDLTNEFVLISTDLDYKYPSTLEIDFEYKEKKDKVLFHIDSIE